MKKEAGRQEPAFEEWTVFYKTFYEVFHNFPLTFKGNKKPYGKGQISLWIEY